MPVPVSASARIGRWHSREGECQCWKLTQNVRSSRCHWLRRNISAADTEKEKKSMAIADVIIKRMNKSIADTKKEQISVSTADVHHCPSISTERWHTEFQNQLLTLGENRTPSEAASERPKATRLWVVGRRCPIPWKSTSRFTPSVKWSLWRLSNQLSIVSLSLTLFFYFSSSSSCL